MNQSTRFTARIAAIVALGGFLMGFDASVISGVVGFIETEFNLSKLQLGWSVASLTLTATLAMLGAGPLSDRVGRRPVLKLAAVLFALSAVASAMAPGFVSLVAARMIGGLGVGAALIVAPMTIAEIAPAEMRGRLVSFNQLNIVIGISVAFFSNYLILSLGQSELAWAQWLRLDTWNWRWMLGIEALPAIVYLLALATVPESPRWLAMRGRDADARQVFLRAAGPEQADAALAEVRESLCASGEQQAAAFKELFRPAMRLVLTVGIAVAILQQITGINSVFFYAPMIFEQSGIGTDASFLQAVLVGLVNLVFTIVAMLCIDRLGRRPLLIAGLAGIAVCMLSLAYGFGNASYSLDRAALERLSAPLDTELIEPILDVSYDSDVAFPRRGSRRDRRRAVPPAPGTTDQCGDRRGLDADPARYPGFRSQLCGLAGAGDVGAVLRTVSEPVASRGRVPCGLVNSAVSFGVQLVFPWELANFGSSLTFLIYGIFAVFGLVFVTAVVPETRGRSLEELERRLVGS